ncbi:NUDIX domain-containing protein [Bacillus sp. AK128]
MFLVSEELLFNIFLEEIESNHTYCKVKHREAVRAIILHDHKILLIQSNKGDYKFPGGGLEDNENHLDALIREVSEETGYINCEVKKKIGTYIERKLDEYETDTLFQMSSYYYICQLTNKEKVEQQLDDYEQALQFTPVWVPLDSAVEQNESLIHESEMNGWIKRETLVLQKLKDMQKSCL